MAQPPPSFLSPRGILSLPSRLCNPPPAVGKVRSCGVTPVLDIRLEDVLARRHLPPIGLKDLEEYLLYVEHSPENLYFILWLNDYTARYHAWVQREKSSRVSKKEKWMSKQPGRQNFCLPPTPDPALAMFYLRAKQTFFTPNGEYELNIPSDVLAPFHSAPHNHPSPAQEHNRSSLWHSQSVHPDPAVFTEVAMEARTMLNESLRRFVRAAYTNVGSQRAVCGIVAGCFFTFVGGLVPLVLTTGRWNVGPHGRLIRLAAIPGLWFGLTVLIASLQGICIMIYVFGDLRQLRKFELARPTISRPMPSSIASPVSFGSTHTHGQPLFTPSRSAPAPEKTMTSPTLSHLDSPTSLGGPARPFAHFSSTTLGATSCESCESESCSSVGCNEIDVSPAFFDDVPAPEGPATASCLHRPEYRAPPPAITYVEPAHVRPDPRSGRVPMSTPTNSSPPVAVDPSQNMRTIRSSMKNSYDYGPTAGFIPNDYSSNSTVSLSDTSRSLRSQRSARFFDFDLLPSHTGGHRRDSTSGSEGVSLPVDTNIPPLTSIVVGASSPHPSAPASPSYTGPGSFLGRAQYKCNNPARSSAPDKGASLASCTKRSSRWSSLTLLIPSFTAGVPAFATPLTRVQSPAVKRAQWEVVIRAALVSAVITAALTGIVVGVVP